MASLFTRVAFPLLALGAFPASAALAQDAQGAGAEHETIVVSGIREKEEKIDDFIGDLSATSVNGPMSRYDEGEYCPRVAGLSEARNEQIAARMRQVATAAGLQPAAAGCKTSALVIFAGDQAAAKDAFRKQHPKYFQELTGDRVVFQGEGSPVLSWKLIGRLDRNGNPVAVNEDGIQVVELPVGSSRLRSATRPVIAMSVVLIELPAIKGLTVQQIADYAFMRTVTDADPGELKKSNIPTILKVMDIPVGGATPLSLTEWDLAYVKGRYASDEWNYGPTQQAAIRGEMRRQLLGARGER